MGILNELINEINKVLSDKSKVFVTKDNIVINMNREYLRSHAKINKLLNNLNILFKGYRIAFIDKKFCVINNINSELEECYTCLNKALNYVLNKEE